MIKGTRVITRRDFIRTGSCMALGGLIGLPLVESLPAAVAMSRVVLIRDPRVIDNHGEVVPDVLEKMLDLALRTLLETRDTLSAWKQLVDPSDVVGIKSNVWYHLPTPEPLERNIQQGLLSAGVRPENIAVDDRGIRRNPVFKRSTVLINVRPMRTHHWSGLGTLIKNYIMFAPAPSRYHRNACEPLGQVWHLPEVKGKTRLNILVMLTPLFHGIGPHHFARNYTWKYCGLIVSTDPVAADATGAWIIQAKRNAYFRGETPISPPPRHIAAADTRYGLGNSRPDRIELIKLGWEEGILI